MIHSKKIEETALWRAYQGKAVSGSERVVWVKEICEAAIKYMMDVRQTFQNYTLHDETHIINVLDAMGGVLGDQVSQLTVGEMELLILAASLHDLGMVYTEEEKRRCFQDAEKCENFLKVYCPEYLDCPAKDWPEDIRQWYLRTLHPFRVPEVLQNEVWKELFARCPLEAVPKRYVLAVCKSHGENPQDFLLNRDLEHLAANDADPLFCALLLRLSDLLDFDDTRAPKVLYGYVACNEKSRAEWDKHQASAGFRYPAAPSTDELPYKAICTNPGVEHAVRDFLDWVDDELGNCIRLQKYCKTGWQREFPFPRAVLRKEIESDGYMSGDFCMTMDQTQILKLLTGENLYDGNDVFVRELLQNAIDATLLRGRMEPGFKPEQSRIDIWEWSDKEGNIWFRMDDQGTGMTLGMLKNYFLKVGNSYYTSREMERDLRDHGQTEKYNGISRFGIGFLSCFLCGDYVEVSTLYFDPNKNRKEEGASESYPTVRYGLRLQVTGLSGYYTLKNQAEQHGTEGAMPMPDGYGTSKGQGYERDGYRAKAGTSIAIRLNPGKLGAMSLRDAVEKYLCGARVPVYFNNKRIGRTYEEMMQTAHELAGEKLYELPEKMKEEFDRTFPAVRGQYPMIAMTMVPLDTEEDYVLPGMSGILIKYEVRFEKVPEWQIKDQKYVVEGFVEGDENILQVLLHSICAYSMRGKAGAWELVEKKYGEAATALEVEFGRYSACPREEQLGEVWSPFMWHMNLYELWVSYHEYQQAGSLRFPLEKCGCPSAYALGFGCLLEKLRCAYQGVTAGGMLDAYSHKYSRAGIFFLENEWRPETAVSRSDIKGVPLTVLVLIEGILSKYQMYDYNFMCSSYLYNGNSLKEWRKMRISGLKQWMDLNLEKLFVERKQFLKESLLTINADGQYYYVYSDRNNTILNWYWDAYFQDYYHMTVNYEEGQSISFCEKTEAEKESVLDLFPPMLFCKAANDRSRQYICADFVPWRKGITIDHPFVKWLLENAVLLNQYYQRQFQQIIDCLCNRSREYILQECNNIRQQLMKLPEHHGVDVDGFPLLSKDDFWSMDEPMDD